MATVSLLPGPCWLAGSNPRLLIGARGQWVRICRRRVATIPVAPVLTGRWWCSWLVPRPLKISIGELLVLRVR